MFQPVQIAAIAALNRPQDSVGETALRYRVRRDVLCDGLAHAGWEIPRVALIENEHRTRQAVRGIRKAFGGSDAGSSS
jgi:aspartate/methionine/tyrosine aminotransferase